MHMKIDQKRLDGILFSIIDKGKLMVISLELSLISKKYILPVRNCFGILEPNAIFRVYFSFIYIYFDGFLKSTVLQIRKPHEVDEIILEISFFKFSSKFGIGSRSYL